jgi:hypothetical protein
MEQIDLIKLLMQESVSPRTRMVLIEGFRVLLVLCGCKEGVWQGELCDAYRCRGVSPASCAALSDIDASTKL